MSATEVCNVDFQQFAASRRSGRRNAMADLNTEGMSEADAQKLAEQLAKMGHDDLEDEPSTSGKDCGNEGLSIQFFL